MQGVFVIGEVSLSGAIKPVNGILPMIAEAREQGMKYAFVPYANYEEALLVKEIEIFPVASVAEVISIVLNDFRVSSGKKAEDAAGLGTETPDMVREVMLQKEKTPDFADISGQKVVKRACEVAVSGMHNLLLIGPPGAGKTMLAMRIPSILPPLHEKEQIELSKIYSVCGLFEQRKHLMEERPFRCPHHTVTAQGLAGGGMIPKPGEISLAHKGVLFLDELPEFQKNTLEVLRQPMKEKVARIVRLSGNYEYPADFMLVAASNPCPCGYFPDRNKCKCTELEIRKYLGKISGPILDRIDLCCQMSAINIEELQADKSQEDSKTIRGRVLDAMEIQKRRFQNTGYRFNADILPEDVQKYCVLEDKAGLMLNRLYTKLKLSARSYHRLLKVSRTIADLEHSDRISDRHIKEAAGYRMSFVQDREG